MAVGALRALKERGIKVPEDVSIVGADNKKIVSYVDPKITTVDNMSSELGRVAVKQLIQMIQGRTVNNVYLDSKIIYNESI